MTLDEVIRFFGGVKKDVAEAAEVTPQALTSWTRRGHVPLEKQWLLQAKTNNQLKVDPVLVGMEVVSIEAKPLTGRRARRWTSS